MDRTASGCSAWRTQYELLGCLHAPLADNRLTKGNLRRYIKQDGAVYDVYWADWNEGSAKLE